MKTPATSRLLLVADLLSVAILFGLIALCADSAGDVITLIGMTGLGMAVTANQTIKRRDDERAAHPVAATTHIYAGTLVFLNAAGYADDDIAAGANTFAGVSIAEVDNSGGANGDTDVEVYAEGIFELTGAGFTQGTVGENIYASDNYTATETSTNNVLIGTCVEFVSATKILVKFHKRPKRGAAVTAPAGGATVDAEARTAINDIRARLAELDLIA